MTILETAPRLTPAERAAMDWLMPRVEAMMRRMTPARRMQFVEKLADLAGVTLISQATAAAIDDAHRRAELVYRSTTPSLRQSDMRSRPARCRRQSFGKLTLELRRPLRIRPWRLKAGGRLFPPAPPYAMRSCGILAASGIRSLGVTRRLLQIRVSVSRPGIPSPLILAICVWMQANGFGEMLSRGVASAHPILPSRLANSNISSCSRRVGIR